MKHIEEKANKILKQLDLTVPISVEGIAQTLNIEIKKASDEEISVSGLLYRKDGIAYMAINSAEPEVRQRFTIAHEIGHFILHESKDIFIEYREKTKDNTIELKTNKEIEANHFSACLLMPREEIEKDVKKINNQISKNEIEILATKYKVSEDAMTFRLLNLNLFSKSL